MGDTAALVAALNATWFGSGLPPSAQTRLGELGRLETYPGGRELLTEGEVCEEVGIVLEGRIALRTLVPERGMVTILTIEPGDVWGWSAIVPPYRGTSTVVTIEPVTSIVFEGAALRIALREDSQLAQVLYPRILVAVSRRLAASRLQLLDLFARDATAGA
jgi:CRP/FNR family transcriptional regulator, cyclic AMP receptor protein